MKSSVPSRFLPVNPRSGPEGVSRATHSSLMPPLRTTSAHFATSVFIQADSCSGFIVDTSAPWRARYSRISGTFRMRAMSADNRSSAARGLLWRYVHRGYQPLPV